MPNDDSSNIDNQLLAKLVGCAPSLPDLSDSEPDRFFAEVRNLLEVRAQSSWNNEDSANKCAVFVLVPFPRNPFAAGAFKLARVTDLPVTNEQVFGRVFFLAFNAANGTTMKLPVDTSNVLDWLTTNGLGSCPVAIAYRDTLEISLRTSATADEVSFQRIRNKKPELSLDSIKDALSAFHKDRLMTPTSCGTGIWEPKRSFEYVPARDTEKAIQQRLTDHLSGWFRRFVRVGTEDTVSKGRIDVRLLAPPENGHGLKYWSIIELKVARSFHNAKKGKALRNVREGSVISEILKGIQQAHEFAKEVRVKEGFLEIYDMRKDKSTDLLEHEKVADKFSKCTVAVNAKVRPMFGSSEDARTYCFEAN